jgi:hypothetical protein
MDNDKVVFPRDGQGFRAEIRIGRVPHVSVLHVGLLTLPPVSTVSFVPRLW